MLRIWLVSLSIALGAGNAVCAADDSQAASARLWREVDEQISQLRSELGFDRLSPGVREVLVKVPRERFVPPGERHNAYANEPLPIGYGQTISQPLIVAVMTELLQVKRGDRIFELGTGSAYQAAVLDELGAEVYSVEIVPELGQRARQTLDELGHTAVNSRVGDGYFGWQEVAPFDAIIVTAASDHIPPPLLRQLKPGGRMVIPVGTRYSTQKLVLVSRDKRGAVRTRELLPVFFVPLTGQR
ncbi:MAG: protein-L-isoaspartate(D-aspartate) O-methyltransferase [Chromatiaceae bacterium]|jgi:protein-L-isoaspartate(D-aspartate) O-methyltransferase|nr:protein-L-isoaspartate(D-aspartate) O-methyltransferase [Chromatiaceae bacterium]